MPLREFVRTNPLSSLLLLGLFLRLLAVWNAPGYLMHDDHFMVIEASASWAAGADYNNWLPQSQRDAGIDNPTPHQSNLAYAGTQWICFKALNVLGVHHPEHQMLWIRLLHALYSLLTILLGFKIVALCSNRKAAIWTGLALATFAWFPMLSVRQLVEMVCIPPLLWSTWVLVSKPSDQWNYRTMLVAGIGLGIATTLRYQCGIFGVGLGLALMLQRHETTILKRMSLLAVLSVSSLFFFALGQLQDWFIWGQPFAQLQAYIDYNATHAGEYPQGLWHQYIWTLLGMLLPPLSLAWLFGFFYVTRTQLLLVLPTFLFLVFHGFFPNKQERFILPAVPYIIMAGTIGWMAFRQRSTFWLQNKGLEKRLLVSTLFLSTILSLGFCFVFAKSSRVQSMTALYENGDLENFLVVHVDSHAMPPQFYSGSWEKYWYSDKETDIPNHRRVMCNSTSRVFPNYILFFGDQHLGESVMAYKAAYPSMEYVRHIPAGNWDRLLARINPVNSVERVIIYRIDRENECP